MISCFNFLCWAVVVALIVKFLRTLAEKWGILSYLQAHAPCDFLYKLFSCEFCQSFWLGMIICIVMVCVGFKPIVLLIPILSSNIR